MEKLELCGYPTVKKFEDMYTRFDTIHHRDGQTLYDSKSSAAIKFAYNNLFGTTDCKH